MVAGGWWFWFTGDVVIWFIAVISAVVGILVSAMVSFGVVVQW